MDMEAETTEAACLNKELIAKGKRTKRQRPNSPFFTTDIHRLPPRSTAIFAASSEESTTTEEVDTANCLILLSRGPTNRSSNTNRHNEAATTSARAAGGGACMYTCKTCGRSFRSFQALGGHRASHGKPKNEKKPAMFSDEEDFPSPSSPKNRFSPNSLSLQLSYSPTLPSPRVHECSYCGAEFSSGQALGGHMRKHRAAAPINRSSKIPQEIPIHDLHLDLRNKPTNCLSLDLNLPAPEDIPCPPLIKRHD